MHSGSLILLIGAAAAVAVVHSILPDHWVPLAVVARTQRWSLWRVAGISGLAAGGHVLASLALAGVVALVGLRFQRQIEAQQGHLIGAILAVTGLAFLIWGLAGHGHAHGHEHGEGDSHQAGHDHGPGGHDHGPAHEHDDHDHQAGTHDHGRGPAHEDPEQHQEGEAHEHDHDPAELTTGEHRHEHAHAEQIHSHPHSHEAFVENRSRVLAHRSGQAGLAARLATIAVPFGVAASPDLTILPVGLAASGYGPGPVIAVLAVFGTLTIGAFIGLTVAATAAGYQVKGEWLEKNANTITSLVLIAVGVVAYLGF